MRPIFHFAKELYRYGGSALMLNAALLFGIGLLQSFGIVLILPLLSMAGLQLDLSGIPYISSLMNLFGQLPQRWGLPVILAGYVLIIAGQGWIGRKAAIVNKQIQLGYVRHLREDTYHLLLRSNWAFFLANRKSDLVKMMTSEVANVKRGLSMYFQFVSSLIMAAVHLSLALLLSPAITMFIIASGALLLFCSRIYTRRSKDFGKENQEISKQYIARITDDLAGMKEIKGNTLEAARARWMNELCDKAERNTLEQTKLRMNSQFLYNVVSAVVLAFGVYALILLFEAQTAQLLLIVTIFSRLWPIVARIQSKLESLAVLVPSFEALLALRKECLRAQELEDGGEWEDAEPLRLKEGVRFQNVSFRYPGKESDALTRVSLFIPACGMTAIVGPSGAGKSTLVDLLMGLNRPQGGEIAVDGVPLASGLLLPMRRAVSYVPQEPFLFHGTIRDNLLLMEPAADEGMLWEALEAASAAELVRLLPDGLDARIGDRGVRLSGGEKQRLVLARALLRNPAVLILDEATSALDTMTETKVQETLERLKEKMAVVVISHRLSTIRNADQVVVLYRGLVAQRGRYADLAGEPNGLFGRLLRRQAEPASGL